MAEDPGQPNRSHDPPAIVAARGDDVEGTIVTRVRFESALQTLEAVRHESLRDFLS